jgi:hypothetical protein
VAGFIEKQHPWIEIFASTIDDFTTTLVDDATEFTLQVGNIIQELVLLGVVVSVVRTDQPPGADAVELVVDEMLDIPFQALGLCTGCEE